MTDNRTIQQEETSCENTTARIIAGVGGRESAIAREGEGLNPPKNDVLTGPAHSL